MRDITIRCATLADVEILAKIHVRAWQVGYRGLMPQEALDQLSIERRAEQWREWLACDQQENRVAVVEGEVVGFVLFGAERSGTEPTNRGEVIALNVEPAHWGGGAGRLLLAAACEGLAALGYREAILWVLTENARARRFYERAGFVADGGIKTQSWLGATLEEMRYRAQLP
jgi:RimJ/RimL family protein N-acetyltransferase